MMSKLLLPALVITLLAGCSSPEGTSRRGAERAKVDPAQSLNMEQLCKGQAARRYNTGSQKIDVTRFEQFQGSYELQGATARKESFVCSFDAEGQFLHLSMR
ncbi:YsaB family lipoprotein [uncultured Pluralibacter sp.]|uniref:YsaB family lipoprotein n=1 Tax=uncultured Pluralibacter sp. TaxID=1490864 RepID=UPI00262103AE|nr:YsaB family lipoprotein [uncultured Pluralibacter sp.]